VDARLSLQYTKPRGSLPPDAVRRDRLVWGGLTTFMRAADAGSECCKVALRQIYPRGRRTAVAYGCVANGATDATGVHSGVRPIDPMIGADSLESSRAYHPRSITEVKASPAPRTTGTRHGLSLPRYWPPTLIVVPQLFIDAGGCCASDLRLHLSTVA
jgi:hypothetical protein